MNRVIKQDLRLRINWWGRSDGLTLDGSIRLESVLLYDTAWYLYCFKWSTKSYDFTPQTPIVFPLDLATTCSKIIKIIPWDAVFENQFDQPTDWRNWQDDYSELVPNSLRIHQTRVLAESVPVEPDTGIVNFYQMNDTLMGHVDRAEWVSWLPLTFSLISFQGSIRPDR